MLSKLALRLRAAVLLAAALAIVLGGIGAARLRLFDTFEPARPASSASAQPPAARAAPAERSFGALQDRVLQGDDGRRALTARALGYLQQGRESGDPTLYTRAEELLRRALATAPDDP